MPNYKWPKTLYLVLSSKIWPYVIIVAAVFLAYADTFQNTFIFDDQKLIVENEFLRHWSSFLTLFLTPIMAGSSVPSDFYRPLQLVFYFIVFQCGGLSIVGFHLLNIGFHAANACLVYKLGRRLKFDPSAVLFSALLWGLHPIHTEAVTYMSGTADILCVFFGLLCILSLFPDFSPQRFYLAAFFETCGLLSKETAVVFPILAVICLFMVDRGYPKKIYIRTWLLWVIVAFYIFVRFVFTPFNPQEFVNVHPELHEYGMHILIRLYTFLATIPAYLSLLVWPTALHMERQFPILLQPNIEALFGLLLLIVACAQILNSRTSLNFSPVSWGLLWFMGAHFPDTGLLIPINAVFLEHWMYLPTIGLSLGMGASLERHIPKRLELFIGISIGIIIFIFGYLTFQQNKVWYDGVTFYKNILDHGEQSVRAHNNLGTAYSEIGDYPRALEQFNLAIQLGDFYPETHENIAAVYSKMPGGGPHTIPEEIKELKRALELDPNYFLAAQALAGTYGYLGQKENAQYYQDMATRIRQHYQNDDKN